MDTNQNYKQQISTHTHHTKNVAASLPNAIDVFENFKEKIQNKKLIIFLDYDGTLTPIVAQPDQALIPDHALNLINNLATHYFVGIVTGRGKDTIKQFMHISNIQESPIALLTSHGFSIECNYTHEMMSRLQLPHTLDRGRITHIVGQEELPFLNEFEHTIRNQLTHIQGVHIENNLYTLSIHYRNVPDHLIESIEMKIDEILLAYKMLKKTFGKKVFEIRLNFEWDKGKAIVWLLHHLGYPSENEDIFPIYLGDDITDEDAFRDIKNYANSSSVLVGLDDQRQTYALQRLRGPDEVYQFLQLLLSV